MLIGIPKEMKNNENRVALTPAGVHSLVGRGHRVLIDTNAGLGSGFTDADYQKQAQSRHDWLLSSNLDSNIFY